MKQPPDVRVYLDDVRRAALLIQEFIAGKTFQDYTADAMLRSAVERQLQIAGEAVGQMLKAFPDMKADLPDAPAIISFRNLLVHGYAYVSHELVWGIVEGSLPILFSQVTHLLTLNTGEGGRT